MYLALLSRTGVEADFAADGDTALARLRRRDYDAVILDLMLPGTNGFEIIRYLKCLQAALLDRVIVVSAASQQTLEFFESGLVRKVLRKPFDIHELLAEVHACIGESADVREADERSFPMAQASH
jgi:DNA-binding response OmpR family regulator